VNTMLSVTERTRPVMEYVRELETKVRYFQQMQRRFSLRIFLAGMAAGAAISVAGWYILHH